MNSEVKEILEQRGESYGDFRTKGRKLWRF